MLSVRATTPPPWTNRAGAPLSTREAGADESQSARWSFKQVRPPVIAEPPTSPWAPKSSMGAGPIVGSTFVTICDEKGAPTARRQELKAGEDPRRVAHRLTREAWAAKTPDFYDGSEQVVAAKPLGYPCGGRRAGRLRPRGRRPERQSNSRRKWGRRMRLIRLLIIRYRLKFERWRLLAKCSLTSRG